jgi:gluconolactonase
VRRPGIAAIAGLAMLLAAGAARAAVVEIVATGLQFPEGPIFVGSTLYFVDYGTSDVLRLAANKVERVWHQDGCGANGLVQLADTLLVACFDAGTVVQIGLDGQAVGTISHDQAGEPFIAPNDLATDGKGGVYFTGSGSGAILGKVYYRAADGRVTAVAADIQFANGLVVSPDGRVLYVAETRTGCLLRFSIAADGTLSDRRPFVRLADILRDPAHTEYSPDGVRIDRRGNLFVGLYNGGGFAVIAPDGTLIQQVDLPAPHHANLAITPDGKNVYVTAVYDQADGSYRGALDRIANPLAN